jgi:hypothetical protein
MTTQGVPELGPSRWLRRVLGLAASLAVLTFLAGTGRAFVDDGRKPQFIQGSMRERSVKAPESQVGAQALVQAVLQSDKMGFLRLLKEGASPNLPVEIESRYRKVLGLTGKAPAMVIAAMHKDPSFLKAALDHGGATAQQSFARCSPNMMQT